MYLHIGGDSVVLDEEIIAIIPRTTALRSRDTRRAIDDAIGAYRIQAASGEMEKSYIICDKTSRLAVYSSPIASTTLAKRPPDELA